MRSTQGSWSSEAQSTVYYRRWVAVNNCRVDEVTKTPVVGDCVDSDESLADLIERLRASGQRGCKVMRSDCHTVIRPKMPTIPKEP